MDKDEKIAAVLAYLNNKIKVMSGAETETVRAIAAAGDITLHDVVEWYIAYVNRSC